MLQRKVCNFAFILSQFGEKPGCPLYIVRTYEVRKKSELFLAKLDRVNLLSRTIDIDQTT